MLDGGDERIDFSSLDEAQWRMMVWQQLRYTNGNVRGLLTWKAQITAVVAVLVMVVVPLGTAVIGHLL